MVNSELIVGKRSTQHAEYPGKVSGKQQKAVVKT
jgi:hypothetical protein